MFLQPEPCLHSLEIASRWDCPSSWIILYTLLESCRFRYFQKLLFATMGYKMGDYPGDRSSSDSPTYRDSTRIVEDKGIGLGEAADAYGDLRSAEEYGYVTRGLKSRHIQFIALGGTIGTGLFLGIGRAFTQAGPLSLFLGYSFTGVAVYAMVHISTRLLGSETFADDVFSR